MRTRPLGLTTNDNLQETLTPTSEETSFVLVSLYECLLTGFFFILSDWFLRSIFQTDKTIQAMTTFSLTAQNFNPSSTTPITLATKSVTLN